MIGPIDGHDTVAVGRAIEQAKTCADRPTLIVCRTTIGRGSPGRAGTAKAHGEPLGADEIAATRAAIGWKPGAFEIPDDVRAQWSAAERGATQEAAWRRAFEAYRTEHPELAAEFERRITGALPADFHETAVALMARMGQSTEAVATRKASQQALAVLAPAIPELIGGSADLTGSNLTDFPGCGAVRGGQAGGRHINYGVREFGMAAIMNGAGAARRLHPLRRHVPDLQRLQPQRRAHGRADEAARDPCLHARLDRPRRGRADAPGGRACRQPAPDSEPGCLAPLRCGGDGGGLARTHSSKRNGRARCCCRARTCRPKRARRNRCVDIRRGGYVLSDRPGATGGAAGHRLGGCDRDGRAAAARCAGRAGARGLAARGTVFDRQPRAWREAVLGRGLPRIGIEAGVTRWWGQYGCVAALGVDSFGESAPGAQVYEHFGLTAERLADLVVSTIEARGAEAFDELRCRAAFELSRWS